MTSFRDDRMIGAFRRRLTRILLGAMAALGTFIVLIFTIISLLRERQQVEVLHHSLAADFFAKAMPEGRLEEAGVERFTTGLVEAHNHEGQLLAYAVYDREGASLRRFGTSGTGEKFLPTKLDAAQPLWRSEWLSLHRFLTVSIHAKGDFRILITADVRSSLMDEVSKALILAIPFALILGFIVAHYLIRQFTEPLQAIAATAAEIAAGKLSARLPEAPLASLDELRLALNHAFAEMEGNFQTIERFSADAAHELKTPLTALRGQLELSLRRQRQPEEYEDALASALDQVVELSRIVETLLLLSRPGHADPAQASSLCDLRKLVAAAVERLGPYAEERGVELRSSVSPEEVRGDAAQLDRLIGNLLHNAIKFSPPGGRVLLQSGRDARQGVWLSVEDQGPGIAAEHQVRIFDRFYQVDPSRQQGSGLGLALVKWIAERHRIDMRLESSPGQGSRFILRFP
ncbi:MAG: hypothetical protein RL095_704 [Verrucomicrobiota bacterium]|jgi:heavy metal sensor kinase